MSSATRSRNASIFDTRGARAGGTAKAVWPVSRSRSRARRIFRMVFRLPSDDPLVRERRPS